MSGPSGRSVTVILRDGSRTEMRRFQGARAAEVAGFLRELADEWEAGSVPGFEALVDRVGRVADLLAKAKRDDPQFVVQIEEVRDELALIWDELCEPGVDLVEQVDEVVGHGGSVSCEAVVDGSDVDDSLSTTVRAASGAGLSHSVSPASEDPIGCVS